jgi:hypothetical protein
VEDGYDYHEKDLIQSGNSLKVLTRDNLNLLLPLGKIEETDESTLPPLTKSVIDEIQPVEQNGFSIAKVLAENPHSLRQT